MKCKWCGKDIVLNVSGETQWEHKHNRTAFCSAIDRPFDLVYQPGKYIIETFITFPTVKPNDVTKFPWRLRPTGHEPYIRGAEASMVLFDEVNDHG